MLRDVDLLSAFFDNEGDNGEGDARLAAQPVLVDAALQLAMRIRASTRDSRHRQRGPVGTAAFATAPAPAAQPAAGVLFTREMLQVHAGIT